MHYCAIYLTCLVFLWNYFSLVDSNALLTPTSRGMMWTRNSFNSAGYNYMEINCGGVHFYATGAHHLLIASLHNVSRASVGRAIDRVTSALNDLLCRYIFFPCRQRLEEIQKEFYSIAGFPRVVGCVDGTHIRIKAPTENEGDFVNRKGFHSINAQMVCDSQFRVLDLVSKWPGSVHDSRIFRESSLCRRFENGQIDGLLLGDSGYPCRSYLMTPYLNPQNLSQERFNAALVKTRVLVEQTFGIIKRRFPCLSYGIRTSPAKACQTTAACVVLHNFGLENHDTFSRGTEPSNDYPDVGRPDGALDNNGGARYRDFIAQNYF